MRTYAMRIVIYIADGDTPNNIISPGFSSCKGFKNDCTSLWSLSIIFFVDMRMFFVVVFFLLQSSSVSTTGTGHLAPRSPCPVMPDPEPSLNGMARCLALYDSHLFPLCK